MSATIAVSEIKLEIAATTKPTDKPPAPDAKQRDESSESIEQDLRQVLPLSEYEKERAEHNEFLPSEIRFLLLGALRVLGGSMHAFAVPRIRKSKDLNTHSFAKH